MLSQEHEEDSFRLAFVVQSLYLGTVPDTARVLETSKTEDPHLEEVEAPGVHLRMRLCVDAGHHAAVKRVLPVQAQAVPRRPQEPKNTSYSSSLKKAEKNISNFRIKNSTQASNLDESLESLLIKGKRVSRTALKCQTKSTLKNTHLPPGLFSSCRSTEST